MTAETLGLPDIGTGDSIDLVCNALELARTVVVLDTCESVVDEVSELIGAIAERCPRTTVIATSRQTPACTRVPPGRSDRCRPAMRPRCSQKGRCDANGVPAHRCQRARCGADLSGGRQFAARDRAARGTDADPRSAHDGRSAGRDRPPAVDTHGGHPARHGSLLTTVEFSYQLLDADEQRLFERLSVFVGGFTLEAVEGVCADEQLDVRAIAELLERLVDKSLVTVRDAEWTGRRYGLLDTTRAY